MMRPVQDADAPAIASIYNHYISRTTVTFEERAVTDEEIVQRISRLRPDYPWLVAEVDGHVTGYAYAGPFHVRSAYRYTVETAVYVEPDNAGKGTGSELYEALLGDLRERGYRNAIGSIALPNPPSVALHERFGFRQVAALEEVGLKLGRWVDVGFWQLKL